ncbi:MAG: GNAT family N-acetyltransferase [Streptosporangiaceae bacterium]|nr:GNAT family N-acetyltransferase [Streptosporangiaceae bacterium]
MAHPYPIRPVTDDEFDAFFAVNEHAFHGGPMTESERPLVRARFEADRSLAAFDRTTIAGITGIYSFQMCVPGGLVPAAGVTMVAVLPTHRRRGILRSLMHRQLADIRDRGEPVAALWASEAPLYGRYGYGRATWQATFSFRRAEGGIAPDAPADPALRLRIADPAAVRPELSKVYDTVLPSRPGFFMRNDAWWDRTLSDPAGDRHGFGPLRCVLAEDDGGPRGYALYAGHGRWEEGTFLPDSLLAVRELIAADPAAGAALWADLLSRDLVTELTARLRPADDPLLFQLADPRRARPRVADGVWVRIIDLPAALTRRAYSCPVDAVIDVTDDLLAGNAGRWRLRAPGPAATASGEQAVTCERTEAPADVALGVRELGAAYLGGTRLGSLAAAGLVTENRPGTLAPLSAALSWDPSPWCPVIF